MSADEYILCSVEFFVDSFIVSSVRLELVQFTIKS